MRRLAHRLFTLCSAVSLLLCVAVCGLWWSVRAGEVRFPGTAFRVTAAGPPLVGLRIDNEPELRAAALAHAAATRQLELRAREATAAQRDAQAATSRQLRRATRGSAEARRLTVLHNQASTALSQAEWAFAAANPAPTIAVRSEGLVLPGRLVVVLLAVAPAMWITRRLSRRRRHGWPRDHSARQARLCDACGYDLRHSPGECPECGAPPQPVPCASCGYDLRASPERCPECGTLAQQEINQ